MTQKRIIPAPSKAWAETFIPPKDMFSRTPKIRIEHRFDRIENPPINHSIKEQK